uniref:Immunoglobulin domain-containing protein n=1 Tax=Astyanax mexicanus TaxID=7994 RepID=A0A8B9H499_ASTMX
LMKSLLRWMFGLLSGTGASSEVTGYSGGEVLIKCKYDKEYKSNNKYFCRGSCKIWTTLGKFSLYDNRETEIFTVRFNNLTKGDSGEYWCGAESDWESDHGYKVYFTQVNLSVNGEYFLLFNIFRTELSIQCIYFILYISTFKQ